MSSDNIPSTSKQEGFDSELADANFEAIPSTSKDPSGYADAKLLQDAQQEENELQALGINVYDQTELETEFIAQVNEQIKAEEDESRRKLSQTELKSVVEELRSVKLRIQHIDKALEKSPKENEPLFSKQVKRFVVSIKQEKETKLKQLKKLEAKQKMLLKQCEEGVTLESMEEFLQADEDVEMDEDLKEHLECMFGKKETDQEMMIKTGQMTPFGTIVNKSQAAPRIQATNNVMTDFEKYLLDQSNLHNEKKKVLPKKKAKTKPNTPIKSPKPKKSSKSNFHNGNIVAADDAKNHRNQKSENSTKRKAISGPQEVDSGDESEWLPDESDHDDEPPAKRFKNKTTVVNINLSEDSDDDIEDAKIRRSSKFKTIDDGRQKSYLRRLKDYHRQKLIEMKNNEDDGNEEEMYEEFEGGFQIMYRVWKKLYDYQKTGVRWLWELHLQNCGGILGDEMGLGKTIQIICFLVGLSYSKLMTRGDSYRGLGPTLIICPTTLMHQWVREFHTWWPPFRVAVLHESGSHVGSKESLVRNVFNDNGIIVTSYNAVVKHQDLLVPREWHYVILDEGHKIRNPDAQITVACKQLKTAHRLLLSGSPVQNQLKELWSLFDFIFPGKLGTLPVFMQQFSVPIVQGGYSNATQVQVETSYRCALVLRDTISPYLLRRLKNDVKMHLNLPNKNEQVLFCRLTKDQTRCYKEYLASGEVSNILRGQLKVFMGLIALRKICNHPDLYSGGPAKMLVANNMSGDSDKEDMQFGYYERAGKMIVIDSLLKLWHKQGHRVLLFSQSKQMLDIMEKYVLSKDYKYMRMDGGTSIASRQPAVNKFNSDSSVFLFLLTTRVGGLGVNLTGANRVIIYDPDWNPSTDTQARERAWRIGQNRNVTIYRLITSGTIEEKVYHRQIFKQFLTNKILKDPKQKRFFKNNELYELFTLKEDGEEGTETSAIFAGTGSEVTVSPSKRLSGKKAKDNVAKENSVDDKKEKMRSLAKRLSQMIADPSFGKKKAKNKDKSRKKMKKSSQAYVEGFAVKNLAKQEVFKQPVGSEDKANDKQNDYVLQKLFAKSGVHSALQHDVIMNSGDPDYMLVEGEAEKVAKAAVKALKQSRSQCSGPGTGIPTWTGQNGVIKKQPKAKFGTKKNTRLLGNGTEKKTKSKPSPASCAKPSGEPSSIFTGPKDEISEVDDPSSSSILSRLLTRSQAESSSDENSDIEGDVSRQPKAKSTAILPEHDELLVDIRNFIAFQASVDGQASSDELVAQFKANIPSKDSALFKSMLNQICDFHRDFGSAGIWRLKPEFR